MNRCAVVLYVYSYTFSEQLHNKRAGSGCKVSRFEHEARWGSVVTKHNATEVQKATASESFPQTMENILPTTGQFSTNEIGKFIVKKSIEIVTNSM